MKGNSSSSVNNIIGRADNNVLTTSSTTTKPKSNVTNSKPEYKNSNDDDDDNWDDVDGDHWDDHPVPIREVHAQSANKTKEDPFDSSKPASLTASSSVAPSVEELLKEQQLSANVPVITSLKKTIPESKSTQTILKKESEEDDIFASMGLSTLPKTSAKKTAPVRTSSANVPSSSAVSSSLIAAELVPSESEDAGSDWGDDSDLNDLLDD
jgi:hypothetical protein